MVNPIGYTQRHYSEKHDAKAEKLGGHWKLKDRNVTVTNLIWTTMMVILSKQINGHLSWETLAILKVHYKMKEAMI